MREPNRNSFKKKTVTSPSEIRTILPVPLNLARRRPLQESLLVESEKRTMVRQCAEKFHEARNRTLESSEGHPKCECRGLDARKEFQYPCLLTAVLGLEPDSAKLDLIFKLGGGSGGGSIV